MNQDNGNNFGFGERVNEDTLTGTNTYNGQVHENTEYTQQNQYSNNSGIAPVSHQYDNVPQRRMRVDNRLIRKLTRPGNTSGFSSIRFIVITLLLSLAIGIGFGIIMMK